MVNQFKFAAYLDRSDFKPLRLAQQLDLAANIGIRGSAYHLRDLMREAYEESVEGSGSSYRDGANYQSSYSLSNFIVARPVPGGYEVGAKNNQIVGRQYVSEILTYMDLGTESDVPWTFQLTGARANNSDDGFITTYGQAPKEFITGVYHEYGMSGFHTDQIKFTQTAITMALGSKLTSYMGDGGVKR